ncbi:MAG: restriction endonuclease subunit S, partial [Bacilli bacterium]|nr:restriction endonuclease subunit S [Bacilli bacterium]
MEENKKNKIPNVPNLRFSGFEPNYQKTKIGKCLKIKSGQDQKNVCCENGKYNIYGTGGVIGTTNTFLYDKESVGIGRKGTIDKPFYFDEPFWTVDTLFYSVINKGFSPKYIYYLFQTINWKKYNSSTGVPSLTSSTIESIDVYITSLKEQCKIAEFLTLIDVRIDTQNKIIEEYQALKNCIFDAIILESRKIGTCKINKIIEEYNVKTTIDNE